MNQLDVVLQQWANFFVSMSQAGAALIGLLFVVITTAAERRPNAFAKVHVYITPTVVLFASVLGVGELGTIPTHTRFSAAVCICLMGIAGLAYSVYLGVGHRKSKNYYEQIDLIFYAAFPFAAYAVLTFGGGMLFHNIQRGLTFVAAGMLFLLTIAIRNSWAMVVDIVFKHPDRNSQ